MFSQFRDANQVNACTRGGKLFHILLDVNGLVGGRSMERIEKDLTENFLDDIGHQTCESGSSNDTMHPSNYLETEGGPHSRPPTHTNQIPRDQTVNWKEYPQQQNQFGKK